MKIFRTTLFTLFVAGGFAAPVLAQVMVPARGEQGLLGGLSSLFGKDKAFSATANMAIKDSSGNVAQAMDMKMAVLDGNVRTEIDMTKSAGSQMPPEAVAHIKQMGMDRTVHITVPDQHMMYTVYPGMKAYTIMQMSADSAASPGAPPKIERTEIGPETIDGHPCIKSKVVITPQGGQATVSYVWEAKDLGGYPIQTETQSPDGTTITCHLRNIDKAKPDAALFAPPSDYTRYDSMQELMMSRMSGMMGGMPGGMPPHGGGGQ
jgi:hypothetical protein